MTYRFQISARILSWPRKCACCGDAPDSHFRAAASRTTGKRVQRTTTSSWEIPYCSACLAHKAAYEAAVLWLWGGVAAGIGAWISASQALSSGQAGFVIGVVVFGASLWPYRKAQTAARAQMKTTCCTPVAAVRYLEWYGSLHTFEFESQTYTNEFLAANNKKTQSDVKKI